MTVKIDGTNGVLQAYAYAAPSSSPYTYTFLAGTQTLVINPSATLASGTITMPLAPDDGMVITFSSTQQITALTVAGNGKTVVGGPTILPAGQAITLVYNSTENSWYPITYVPQLISSAGLATEVQPIGVGQTWTDVTGSRAEATTYTNTTGRTIIAYISVATTSTAGTTGVVNGVTVHTTTTNVTGTMRLPIVLTIPPSGTYSATWSALVSWVELR